MAAGDAAHLRARVADLLVARAARRRPDARFAASGFAGGEPLFRPERAADGRWQRGEVVEGFYLADSEETAWAEWYRALAELAIPPMRQLPRDLWRFELELDRAADLSSPKRLERVGLGKPRKSGLSAFRGQPR